MMALKIIEEVSADCAVNRTFPFERTGFLTIKSREIVFEMLDQPLFVIG